ncbi:hypothetical protein VITFI_CDS1614 [Vitreoscilla filiformis]|uniref:Uncharacterized protein n=1 Tax=Vitreoscilla filiformis TaxID=63 RepID=A0A221KEC6_VITFI|nr:hypothetical protein VITFI_CDS1614 [Vitreoscilla filiformis]
MEVGGHAGCFTPPSFPCAARHVSNPERSNANQHLVDKAPLPLWERGWGEGALPRTPPFPTGTRWLGLGFKKGGGVLRRLPPLPQPLSRKGRGGPWPPHHCTPATNLTRIKSFCHDALQHESLRPGSRVIPDVCLSWAFSFLD